MQEQREKYQDVQQYAKGGTGKRCEQFGQGDGRQIAECCCLGLAQLELPPAVRWRGIPGLVDSQHERPEQSAVTCHVEEYDLIRFLTGEILATTPVGIVSTTYVDTVLVAASLVSSQVFSVLEKGYGLLG